MIKEIDYRTTGIGEVLDHKEMRDRIRTVWGGVSWPSKRPGFIVIVGMDRRTHLDSHDIYLLDEFESFNVRELVRQIGVMDVKYGILRSRRYYMDSIDDWIGDSMNNAADVFIDQMNNQLDRKHDQLSLSYTMLLEMTNLYTYILPLIKDKLTPDRRMLFLKDSKIIDYLAEIEEMDMADMKIGEYPAIEALGFILDGLNDQAVCGIVPEKPYHYDHDPLDASKL